MKKVLIFTSIVIVIVIIAIIAVENKPKPILTMNVTYVADESIKSESVKRCKLLGDIAVRVAMIDTLDATVDSKIYHCNFKVSEEAGARDQVIHLVPKEVDIIGKYKELGFGTNNFDNAVTMCNTSIMSDGTYIHTGKSVSIVSVDRFSGIGTERLQAIDIDIVNGWPKNYGAYSAIMEGLCNGVATAEEFAFSGVKYADYVNEMSQQFVNVGDLSYGHKIKFSVVTKRQYTLLVEECEKLKKSDSN